MAVDAIGGVLGAGSQSLTRSAVSQDDFLRIFLTQLSFQDPLDPLDNREFVTQLAQFTSVEQSRLLNENVEGLLSVDASSQALGLLGRSVILQSINGEQIGEITAINFRSGTPEFTVTLADGSVLTDISPTQIALVQSN